MDPKIMIVLKTHSQSKDKDTVQQQNQTVKINIVKPESFT